MTWVQDQLEDEKIFPDTIGEPFPKVMIYGDAIKYSPRILK